NAAAITEICRRLDGIPLAIELAAAQVTVLPVEGIRARLDDCLSLLTSGFRTAPRRQQTLQATMDWSYALLTEAERALLRQLAVSAGDFGLELAEGICVGSAPPTGGVLAVLHALVDKSLVSMEEQAGVPRYRLLETVR